MTEEAAEAARALGVRTIERRVNGELITRTIYRFKLPFSVTLPRKKTEDKVYMLNLNVWKRLHFQTIAQCKTRFHPLPGFMPFRAKRVRIHYEVVKKRNARYDVMNVVACVDKFFCDWLVRNRMIPDDDCLHVEMGHAIGTFGVTDNLYAYVEVLE